MFFYLHLATYSHIYANVNWKKKGESHFVGWT
jgi:hypothetical protein